MYHVRQGCLTLVMLTVVAGCDAKRPPASEPTATPKQPKLTSIGPRVIANDSDTPVYVYGDALVDGMQLQVGDTKVGVTRVTDTLGAATLPPIDLPPDKTVEKLPARLHGPTGPIEGLSFVRIINDADYPSPTDLLVMEDGGVYAVSPTTDTLWRYDAESAPVAVKVGDRPRDLAAWNDGSRRWIVVLHELQDELWLLDPTNLQSPARRLAFQGHGQSIAVYGDVAYVSNRLTDMVHVLDLRVAANDQTAQAKEVAKLAVGVNPRAMALGETKLAVSNLGGDNLVLADVVSGKVTEVVVGPGARIIGGHTQPYGKYAMNLKAPRDIVWSPEHRVFLAAGLGPNIGPNPDRMEVSQNSGVSVISQEGVFQHHVSMRRGSAEQLVVDEDAGVILLADLARGRVVAMNLDAVVEGREAVVAQLFIEPPADTKFLRPVKDYGVEGRATTAMYSGPTAIALGRPGTAFVLNRFTGTVVEVHYEVKSGKVTLTSKKVWRAPDLGKQQLRRSGEVVYATDFGDSRMSCDTCHYEGHNQGTLFTKGQPMHIYRVTSLRSVSETAPYFTPAKFPSLAKISHFVTARNRLQNLPPNTAEVAALVAYQRGFAPPPNPHHGRAEIELPDGAKGRPADGWTLFSQNCTNCHPPPMFTTDQDVETRGRTHETGTVTIDLRPQMQDATPYPVPVPTLVGVWDNHPLFHGGQKGNKVQDERLVPQPFALREVLDDPSHFDTSKMTEQERNDLLAFLLTL